LKQDIRFLISPNPPFPFDSGIDNGHHQMKLPIHPPVIEPDSKGQEGKNEADDSTAEHIGIQHPNGKQNSGYEARYGRANAVE